MFILGWTESSWADASRIKVASKPFTESVIFGDVLTLLARSTGAQVEHTRNLGGTRVLWEAMRKGEIDAYLEYTGTLSQESLLVGTCTPMRSCAQALAAEGIVMHEPLGFDNARRIGMRESEAKRLGITKISDLAKHPDLSIGFYQELMNWADGWQGLQKLYNLPQQDVRARDHDLALRALDSGSLAVTDVFGTDAEILAYHMRLLEDDRHYFPTYMGVVLRRKDVSERAPDVVAAWNRLSGSLTTEQTQALNARTRLEHRSREIPCGFFAGYRESRQR